MDPLVLMTFSGAIVFSLTSEAVAGSGVKSFHSLDPH
jgi:hypothetical protein